MNYLDEKKKLFSLMEKKGVMKKAYSDEPELTEEDVGRLTSYLTNPFHEGVWRLECGWKESSKFSEFLWARLEGELSVKEDVSVGFGKRSKSIKISQELKDKLREYIYCSLTFNWEYFCWLIDSFREDGVDYGFYHKENDFTKLILENVDPSIVKKEFSDAFNFFENNVWFDEFNPVFREDSFKKLKSGWINLLKGPREGKRISMVSWDGDALNLFSDFMKCIDKVEDVVIMPIFSPEEELFSPYFDFLKISIPYIINQDHLQDLFERAISRYEEESYIDCVSAFGLVGEDLLTQVYETLFREQLQKGLTLGQLLDEIQRRVSLLYKKDNESFPDFSELYEKIQSAIGSENDRGIEALEIIRNLLTKQVEGNKYLLKKLESYGKPEKRHSVFPGPLLHLINDLIRFRNASSHHSRIPIGPYEARRAAYSVIVSWKWWEGEKQKINWTQNKEEIIKGCVSRSAI